MNRFPDWIYRQSAVVPFRWRGDALEVLLITSRKRGHWGLPKGIVDPGLSAPGSAVKEAIEEAGIQGDVAPVTLGRYVNEKWGGSCEIEVFPMIVTAELEAWPESEIRRRKWMSIDKAVKQIKVAKLKKIVRRLPEALKSITAREWIPCATATLRQHVIYLFRHAKSSWDDPSLSDSERPLAPRGQRAAEVMRDYMQFAEIEPDLLLCSPSLRTRQSLNIIAPAIIGAHTKVEYHQGLYSAGARALLNRLRRLPEDQGTTMLIGHNPAMQELAIKLAGAGADQALARLDAKFPTAALATLVVMRDRWLDLEPGACDLHSFVRPRELE